jgi:hypothetical protein
MLLLEAPYAETGRINNLLQGCDRLLKVVGKEATRGDPKGEL